MPVQELKTTLVEAEAHDGSWWGNIEYIIAHTRYNIAHARVMSTTSRGSSGLLVKGVKR